MDSTTQEAVTHEIIARQHATPVLVQAIEPQPGLFVYQQPTELLKAGDRRVWRLGHHSGYQIAKFENRGDAEDAARSIKHITDWTRPADDIRADTDGEDIREALLGSPGVFLSSPPAAN
ncbi:hypothetical protein [Streptomyces sp. NBC_01789]|uniref:hypothetical protein n=1 Tax=Streptomyces sp. NBC_01789 TaxID=2975941 RepID=UPI0022527AC5|nr:hypothetical protein [Streptomyces sp. NBC_01789]MCX4450627.1 hypothetical protein [Streptomyces sp. NBC_01789]